MDRERGSAGVIDTLSAGYATVNRFFWIIAIPVLLDLFLWLGPRLSLMPLVQETLDRLQVPAGLPAEMLQGYQDARGGLLRAGESFNLFSLLATHYPGIPSLMSARGGTGVILAVSDPLAASALFLLLPVLGIGLASVYYLWIGLQVERNSAGAGRWWSAVRRTWLRLLAFVLLALGVLLLLGLPVMVLALLVGSLSSSALGFLAAFFWVAAIWVQFYLFFVVEAMVISDVGPIQAVRNSVAVVKSNLGSSLGLVVLVWVITLGMPIVWDALAQNLVGILVGIVGNAYISTGLAAASMIFYRDRFARCAEVLVHGDRGE